MALNLTKGQKLDLTKPDGSTLSTITATVNWQTGSIESDVDVSVALLNTDGKRFPGNDGIMFYNNLDHGHPGLTHSGDDRSGGTGETVTVDLTSVSDDVERMAIVVTSYGGDNGTVTFGQMSVPTITIADAESGDELFFFELDEDASTATALDCGEIYRRNGSWKFEAAGTVLGSSENGMDDVINHYKEA